MPALAIVLVALILGLGQIIELIGPKYGAVSIIGLIALAVGVRAKSVALSSIGAVILFVLLVIRDSQSG